MKIGVDLNDQTVFVTIASNGNSKTAKLTLAQAELLAEQLKHTVDALSKAQIRQQIETQHTTGY